MLWCMSWTALRRSSILCYSYHRGQSPPRHSGSSLLGHLAPMDIFSMWGSANATIYHKPQLALIYHRHEKKQQQKQKQRVCEVGLGSFTLLVFSRYGGMAKSIYLQELIEWDQLYDLVMAWMHCHLSFSCTTTISNHLHACINKWTCNLWYAVSEAKIPLISFDLFF